MEQIFLALGDALPWVEDRYGTRVAAVVAILIILLTMAVMIVTAAWLLR